MGCSRPNSWRRDQESEILNLVIFLHTKYLSLLIKCLPCAKHFWLSVLSGWFHLTLKTRWLCWGREIIKGSILQGLTWRLGEVQWLNHCHMAGGGEAWVFQPLVKWLGCYSTLTLSYKSSRLWVRKIPWRRKWQPTPVFLLGKSHGWRSLMGYRPWGCKELDMTERLHFHFFRHILLTNWVSNGFIKWNSQLYK